VVDALRAHRVKISGRCADLAVQAQSRLQPAIALDEMIREVPSQSDSENRTEEKPTTSRQRAQ